MRLTSSTIAALASLTVVLALTGAACGSDAGSSASTGPASTGPASTGPASAPGSSAAVAKLDGTQCPPLDGSAPKIVHFALAPPTCIAPSKTYTATITTNKGVMVVALDPAAAPIAVNSFVFLAGYHYFDATHATG